MLQNTIRRVMFFPLIPLSRVVEKRKFGSTFGGCWFILRSNEYFMGWFLDAISFLENIPFIKDRPRDWHPYVIGVGLPMAFAFLNSKIKTIINKNIVLAKHRFIGIDLTLVTLSSAVAYIFTLLSSPSESSTNSDIIDTLVFLITVFFLLFYLVPLHQDYEEPPTFDSSGKSSDSRFKSMADFEARQKRYLFYWSNGIAWFLFFVFAVMIKRFNP